MFQPSQEQAAVPQHVSTLKMYEDLGRLPRAPVAELQTRFAGTACDDPECVRDMAAALLQRIDQYWLAIDYCPPMTLRSTGESPTARPAPQFEHQYGSFHWLRITEMADGPQRVWAEAKSMCLNTALVLAQWEFAQFLPGQTDLLRCGRVAAMSACKNELISGSPWSKNSRKLTTSGVRRRLRQTLNSTPNAYLALHPDSGQPIFYVANDFERLAPALQARAREANRPLRISAPR